MANSIQMRRGANASLPTLLAGEFGFSTDTKQVYIGDGSDNYEVLLHALFNAGTFLYAASNDTPVVKTPAEVMGILTGQAAAAFSLNSQKLTSLANGVDANDAINKSQLDAVSAGLDPKESVRLTTAAALPACTAAGSGVGKTLTADAVGVLTVDSVATVLNDRILVKNQSTGADNGIYKVTTEGTGGVAFVLTRAVDADTDAKVTGGMYCFSVVGTDNSGGGFVLTTSGTITVDTTALTFSQFSDVTLDAGLQSLAGLTYTAKSFVQQTALDTFAVRTMAQTMADLSGSAGAEFLFNTQKIGGIVDPTTAQQAATKNYCDTRTIDGGTYT